MGEFLKEQNIILIILNLIISTVIPLIIGFLFNKQLTNLKHNFEIEKLEYQHTFNTEIQEQKIEYEKEIIRLNDVINKNKLVYTLKFKKDFEACFKVWDKYNIYYNLFYELFSFLKANDLNSNIKKISNLITQLDIKNTELNDQIDFYEPFIDNSFHFAIKKSVEYLPSFLLKAYIGEYSKYHFIRYTDSLKTDITQNRTFIKNSLKEKIDTLKEIN